MPLAENSMIIAKDEEILRLCLTLNEHVWNMEKDEKELGYPELDVAISVNPTTS